MGLGAYSQGVAVAGWALQRADGGAGARLDTRTVALLAREAVARAVLWVLAPLGWWSRGPRRAHGHASSESLPTLLLPGMGWNASSLTFLATFLRHRGWDWVWPVGPSRSAHTLAERGAELAKRIQELREASGNDQVDVVAFSSGGLEIAWAIRHDPAARAAVRRLVTLATPWQGTKMASFGRSTAMRQIRYGSPVLDGLWPTATEVVCIWSRDDVLVVPADSAAPPGPATDVCIEAAGHLELLTSARAFRAVRAALEHP